MNYSLPRQLAAGTKVPVSAFNTRRKYMKSLLTIAAMVAAFIATGAQANSLTDWLSLSFSQRVLCCTESSAQVHVRALSWDNRTGRWVSRYTRHYGADSNDCCEMPTHGND